MYNMVRRLVTLTAKRQPLEPVSQLVVESAAEPASVPATEATVEPVAEPAAEPIAEPVAEPVADPAAEPVPEPTAEPTTLEPHIQLAEKADEEKGIPSNESTAAKASPPSTSMSLCSFCSDIDFAPLKKEKWEAESWDNGFPHRPSIRSLFDSAETCPLCRLFSKAIRSFKTVSEEDQVSPEHVQLYWERAQDHGITVERLPGQDALHAVGIKIDHESFRINKYGKNRAPSLAVYASPTSEAARSQDIFAQPILPPGNCQRALEWLENCKAAHTMCKAYYEGGYKPGGKDRPLPTRVIDVGVDGDSGAEVAGGAPPAAGAPPAPTPAAVEPRLLESKGRKGEYLALSHAWGNDPSKVTRTTRATYAAHLERLELPALDATFRDAIIMTRRLGFRYLWIDSLCIVQDDPADWEKEAASMAAVYGDAFLTLSGCRTKSTSSGLMNQRKQWEEVQVPYKTRDLEEDGVFVVSARQPLPVERDAGKGYLDTRGWAFQERILSRRVLYIGKDQLHWQCCETRSSECYGLGKMSVEYGADKSLFDWRIGRINYRGGRVDIKNGHTKSAFDAWYETVSAYSQRLLTLDKDKMPALAGCADRFRSSVGDHYLWGLWKADLLRGLFWTCGSAKKPSSKRAPSWSWASVDGPISFWSGKFAIDATKGLYAEDLPGFEEGKLKLSASCRRLCDSALERYVDDLKLRHHNYKGLLTVGDKRKWTGPASFDFDSLSEKPLFGALLSRLETSPQYYRQDGYSGEYRHVGNFVMVLLLEQSLEEDTYSRVGIAELPPDVFHSSIPRKISII